MRKEVLIAISFGVAVGLIFAFGIWRANFALRSNNKEEKAVDGKAIETQTPTPSLESLKITISKPNDFEVMLASKTSISGLTKPGSWLIISGVDEDYIFQPSQDGSFDKEIKLNSGLNQMIISSFLEPQEDKVNLNLVYSAEFIKKIESAGESDQKTTDATASDSLSDKIRDKVEAVSKKPKAVMGSITDKTEDSLQVKNAVGSISLISIKKAETDFVKSGKTETKISFNDLAIGDFIMAMGFNGNSVLKAERIVVTSPPEEVARHLVLGKIASIDKNKVVLAKPDASEVALEFPKKWFGPDTEDLSEADKILAVYIETEGKLVIRTIFKIPS